MMSRGSRGKYTPDGLVKAFRVAAQCRRQLNEAGLTDNAGAIHAAERVMHLLGPRLVYGLDGVVQDYKHRAGATFSEEALAAHRRGERVLIEHVAPQRALTLAAIERVEAGATDVELVEFVKSKFKLVVLTQEETTRLNKMNRSRLDPERLDKAGIRLAARADRACAEE
jgi:hypothetical protein